MNRVAAGLSYPTSLAFDDEGVAFVAESGLDFNGAKADGRIVRIESNGKCTCLCDGLRAPVNGLVFHDEHFYISEGGYPGRISRLSRGGEWTPVLDGLPGRGNYHTNMVAVGPDGKLYFSQGAMTNSSIVGLDAYDLAWLQQLPHPHDVPGYDIVLAGINVETKDPRPAQNGRAVTGAFMPFGTSTAAGQRITRRVPCTASVMRCNTDGTELELVAWGLRNAYGLGFLPDGRLLATDQGADDRGSRPVGNAPDLLHEINPGSWYGWPDFVGDKPVTDSSFEPTRGPAPEFVLANHAELPPPRRPLMHFPVNAAATKFDVIPESSVHWPGQILVTLFGDEKPMTAPSGPRVGRSVARIDPRDWSLHSLVKGPFERPIDVRFHPIDQAFFVVDFGEFEMTGGGVQTKSKTGSVWRLDLDTFAA